MFTRRTSLPAVRLLRLALTFAALLAAPASRLSAARPVDSQPADDKSAGRVNVSGNWKWTYAVPGGQAVDVSLRLKQDGQKLTGTLIGRYGETEIQDGQVRDGQVSFKVSRKVGDEEITVHFHGTVAGAGDAIAGQADVNTNGQSRSSEWNPRRAAGDGDGDREKTGKNGT